MNDLDKIVVSRTLDQPGWGNTRLISGDVAAQLTELKQGPGKSIAALGSSDLTADLLRMGVLDELRIMVNPVVLGAGRSLLRTAGQRFSLELLGARPFRSGNVLLTYRPAAW